MKWYDGEKKVVSVRRLRCERCNMLHVELPDILTPHKHYATEIIENVVDDVIDSDDDIAENYPCERTMQRWKDWIHQNEIQIDGYLKSIGSRISSLGEELLKVGDSLLTELRKRGAGWLETINRAIYNAGGFIEPYRPPCRMHLLCLGVQGLSEVSLPQEKEVLQHEDKRSNELERRDSSRKVQDYLASHGSGSGS